MNNLDRLWPYAQLFYILTTLLLLGAGLLALEQPAAVAAPRIIRLAAMGDIMLGPAGATSAETARLALTDLKTSLADRQVVIGNLEGPLTNRGTPATTPIEGRAYVFRTEPGYAALLREAGLTILSLANNHAHDYGQPGYDQTREVLDKAGLHYTGGPGQVARQKVGRTTVAVIGLAPHAGCQDLNDIPAAAALVREEAAKPDTLVVVVFHGGAEGSDKIYVPRGLETFLGERRGDLRALSRALIDAGAHLVVGHGPHVPRGLEIYKDRLIAYSLGNFATGPGISISGRQGLAPLLLVDLTPEGRLMGGRVVSFKQERHGQAKLDQNKEAMKLMHRLSLADFDHPGLGADGSVMLTESAARALAGAFPKPAKDQPQPAAALKPKKGDQEGQPNQAAPFRYAWDVYR